MIKFPLNWGTVKERISFLKENLRTRDDKRKIAIGFAVGVVACFFAISAGVGVAVYKSQSRTSFVRMWASFVPYPVAITGLRVITYSEYLKDLNALENFYARQQQLSGLPAPLESELEQAVIDRLLRNMALQNLAKEKKISITKEEIENKFTETVSEVGTREDAEKLIKELYGWDSQTFMDRVLVYYLLEQKLGSSFGSVEDFDALMDSEIAKLKETRFFGK